MSSLKSFFSVPMDKGIIIGWHCVNIWKAKHLQQINNIYKFYPVIWGGCLKKTLSCIWCQGFWARVQFIYFDFCNLILPPWRKKMSMALLGQCIQWPWTSMQWQSMFDYFPCIVCYCVFVSLLNNLWTEHETLNFWALSTHST